MFLASFNLQAEYRFVLVILSVRYALLYYSDVLEVSLPLL